jgi:putative DNA primase/helicase
MQHSSTLAPEKVYVGPGGLLALDLAEFFARFLALPNGAAGLLPIWTLHTYVVDLFRFTPYLNIVSPEHGCGKTTAADVLGSVCFKATLPSCGTDAYFRHKIAAERVSLIIDEWDSLALSTRKLCLNFLNTGFRFDGTYGLMSGGRSVELPTFCCKAIIGRALVRLPEATMSRCIVLGMHKALPGQILEKFGQEQQEEAAHLRVRCGAWAKEFRERKIRPVPIFPDGFDGRQQDITRPLLEIADFCAGPWSLGLRESLKTLFARPVIPSAENELLRAVRKYTSEHKDDYFWSKRLCDWLNEQEDAPWLEGDKVSTMSQAKLAEMLRHYDITPTPINRVINGRQHNQRGYWVKQFEDAFARYL